MKPKRKKWIIGGVALVTAAAVGVGAFFGLRGSGEPVGVYPFTMLGMTEYWGDSQESWGPVSSDNIQTVYLSDTQTVTEILVAQGDEVKKGDVLMTFDTTLSGLQLERKRLDMEKLKLDLDQANDRLWEIRNMKPMEVPEYDWSEEEEADPGETLTEPFLISSDRAYDGTTEEKALICWLRSDTDIDDEVFEAIRQRAVELRSAPSSSSASAPGDITGPTESGGSTGPTESEGSTGPTESGGSTGPTEPEDTTGPTEPEDTTGPTEPEDTTGPTEPEDTTGPTEPEDTTGPTEPEDTTGPTEPEDTTGPTEPTEITEPTEPVENTAFYVVLKMTENNQSKTERTLWQGFYVYGGGTEFRFRLFDAYAVPDYTLIFEEEEEEEEGPGFDYGSGYTLAQIYKMRLEQEETIKDLEIKYKVAEADYKLMAKELSDGNVYAEVDGKVVSVLTEEEARQNMEPVLKVSGGGGFYVQGSVSELERDNLQIGQEVTINDYWEGGGTYTGTVESIGDFPSLSDGWNGNGNPNVSYYPFTVFVDETANLQTGRHVSVQYSTGGVSGGIYLENAFLRSEDGESYVYVRGENGRLEKRTVTVGKSLWGSYTEILSGLSEEDYLAFPYGKDVKEGAPTEEKDPSELYQGY